MNEYITDNLVTVIIAVCITGGSIILNFILGCKLYYKNKEQGNEKISNGIEMVKLEPNNQVEEYVMTIGDARKNVKTEVPKWTVDEYKRKKNIVVL